MEKLLQEMLGEMKGINRRLDGIETEISTMKAEMSSLKDDVSTMKTEMSSMKTEMISINQRLGRVEGKLDAVHEQTATLTEFKTETETRLDKLTGVVEFLSHKLDRNQQDVFVLKKEMGIGL